MITKKTLRAKGSSPKDLPFATETQTSNFWRSDIF